MSVNECKNTPAVKNKNYIAIVSGHTSKIFYSAKTKAQIYVTFVGFITEKEIHAIRAHKWNNENLEKWKRLGLN